MPDITSDKLDTAVVIRRTDSTSDTSTIETASDTTVDVHSASKVRLRRTALLSEVQGQCDHGGSQSKSKTSSTATLHNHVLVRLVNDEFVGIGGVGNQLALSAIAQDENVSAIGTGAGVGDQDVELLRNSVGGGVICSDLSVLSARHNVSA